MKRVLVFLLLGPALVALSVLMAALAIGGRISDSFVAFCVTMSFLLTMPVSVITGLMDGYLARTLPTPLRIPLTAAIGTTIANGLALTLFTAKFSPWAVTPEVINVALCAGFFLLLPMGLCSLLSHDYSGRQRHSIEPVSA